jgi:ATP-dependent Lon protease
LAGSRTKKDLVDIPAEVLEKLDLRLVDSIDEILELAIEQR